MRMFMRIKLRTKQKPHMARPKISNDGGATNIWLPGELKRQGKRLAKEKKMSFSEMIQRLIAAELKRKRGIAHLNERTA
jgi:hypothetical protein